LIGARPISYAYRWKRCGQRCANIPHATGRLLELGAGDRGRRIRVTVTASNLAGAVLLRADAPHRLGPTACLSSCGPAAG
jgi:hypothetical protein